jgi:hypothetical protein
LIIPGIDSLSDEDRVGANDRCAPPHLGEKSCAALLIGGERVVQTA